MTDSHEPTEPTDLGAERERRRPRPLSSTRQVVRPGGSRYEIEVTKDGKRRFVRELPPVGADHDDPTKSA